MSLTPFYIFIVDDNVSDATMLFKALKRARPEARVYTLSDSRLLPSYLDRNSPVELMRQGAAPDLLILQSAMPFYSGRETLDWVRKQARLSQMPVVLLASKENAQDRRHAETAGATSYRVCAQSLEGWQTLATEILKDCAPAHSAANATQLKTSGEAVSALVEAP